MIPTLSEMDDRLGKLNAIFTTNAKSIIDAQQGDEIASKEVIDSLQRIRNDTIILTNFAILARELIITDELKNMSEPSRQSIMANIVIIDEFIALAEKTGLIA